MSLLAKLLNGSTAPERRPPVPTLSAARQNLRDALAEEANKRDAHRGRMSATARVRNLIAAVKPAQVEADAAAKAAADATRRWATSGARVDLPSGDSALLSAAAAAKRRAEEAQLQADGASAALGDVLDAEVTAQRALDTATADVKRARTAVLVAHAATRFAELEQLHTRFTTLLGDVAALAEFVDPKWGPGHAWRAYASGDGGDLKDRVAAIAAVLPDERTLHAKAQHWAALAARLAQDPDAEIIV
jgi:hypothetical protein